MLVGDNADRSSALMTGLRRLIARCNCYVWVSTFRRRTAACENNDPYNSACNPIIYIPIIHCLRHLEFITPAFLFKGYGACKFPRKVHARSYPMDSEKGSVRVE